MARAVIAKEQLIGPYPTFPISAGAATLTGAASDPVNGNAIDFAGYRAMIVLVRNTDGLARSITFTSAADELGRTGDITNYSIDAGVQAGFYFEREGWVQPSDGMLYLTTNNALVQIVAIGIR